jgi:hypothetical protein
MGPAEVWLLQIAALIDPNLTTCTGRVFAAFALVLFAIGKLLSDQDFHATGDGNLSTPPATPATA